MTYTVNFRTEADARALQQLSRESASFGSSLKSAGGMALASTAGIAAAAMAVDLVFSAATAAVDVLGGFVDVFEVLDGRARKLSGALSDLTVTEFDEYLAAIEVEAFASGKAVDDLNDEIANLGDSMVDQGRALDAYRAAMDLSSRTALDYNAAMKLIQNATAGRVRGLQQLMPEEAARIDEIRKMTDAGEREAATIDLITEKYKGSRLEMKRSVTAYRTIENSFGDLHEEAAKFVLEMGSVEDLLVGVAAGMRAVVGSANGMFKAIAIAAGANRDLSKSQVSQIKVAGGVVDAFSAVAVVAVQVTGRLRQAWYFASSGVQLAIGAIMKALGALVGALGEAVSTMLSGLAKLISGLGGLAMELGELGLGLSLKKSSAALKAFNKEIELGSEIAKTWGDDWIKAGNNAAVTAVNIERDINNAMGTIIMEGGKAKAEIAELLDEVDKLLNEPTGGGKGGGKGKGDGDGGPAGEVRKVVEAQRELGQAAALTAYELERQRDLLAEMAERFGTGAQHNAAADAARDAAEAAGEAARVGEVFGAAWKNATGQAQGAFQEMARSVSSGSASIDEALITMITNLAAIFSQFLLATASGMIGLQTMAWPVAAIAGTVLAGISGFIAAAFAGGSSSGAVSAGTAPMEAAVTADTERDRGRDVVVLNADPYMTRGERLRVARRIERDLKAEAWG